jgi:hypothetical protein
MNRNGKPSFPKVQFDAFPLRGGLDLETPTLSLKPGFLADVINFECATRGGYRRIDGYERFDGRPSPTSAIYATLTATAVVGLSVGDSINGQTSGATGVVAAIDATTNLVVYTKTAGTFVVGENLREGVAVIGVVTVVGVIIEDLAQAAGYQLAASNIYRSDIGPVPGSGPVRGGFTFDGDTYAFRDNLGGTACVLHRAGVTGWQVVPFFYELGFTGGSGVQPAEGVTLTKGAVSAVLKRVVIESGDFGSGTAAGRFIVAAPAGGSFTAGAFTAGVTANATGAEVAISPLPGGRYEIRQGNAGNGVRIYGCDAVNRLFEFADDVYVPINTGMANDAPEHIHLHKKHVFASFGPSAQFSGTATPYEWSVLTGAGEIAADQDITGFISLPGDSTTAAMAILTSDTVSVLYGSGPSDWNLVDQPFGIGSKARSQQTLGSTYVFDDLGIAAIQATQNFGNFSSNAITTNIRQFVDARRTLVTDSLVNRSKNQYRLFFSDGSGLWMTIVNDRLVGIGVVQFTNPVLCCWAGESTNGNEVSYFGAADGFVYAMDVGTSFDGGPISFTFATHYMAQGNSRVTKRYRRCVLEMQGDGYAEFQFGYTMAYGDRLGAGGTLIADVQPTFWDIFTWDEFIWDGRALAPTGIRLSGSGENIAISISGEDARWPAFTVNSAIFHYTPRVVLRREGY